MIPGLGRSPGGWQGNPLQYSCLENPYGQRRLVGCNPWGHTELDVTKHAYPLRFMIQIEHARGKRAVSVRVLCVKCLKSTLANLNKRDTGYRVDSEQIGPGTSRRPTWSCLNIPTRKDEPAQPFSVFSPLRRMTPTILAWVSLLGHWPEKR